MERRYAKGIWKADMERRDMERRYMEELKF
jgi:hypothetical protein